MLLVLLLVCALSVPRADGGRIARADPDQRREVSLYLRRQLLGEGPDEEELEAAYAESDGEGGLLVQQLLEKRVERVRQEVDELVSLRSVALMAGCPPATARTFFTPSSYPLSTLSISSSPNVRCRLDSFNSFGFSAAPPHRPRLKPGAVPAVRMHRSEKRLKASRPDADTVISVGGSVASWSGMEGVEGSDEMRSKTSMTAWRSVAAAVDDTTETRVSCSLKQSSSAWSERPTRRDADGGK